MQCVRCSHPLPPRADRCLRCFALNPQNRPEPLPTATPAVPLGSSGIKPLGLSFESDPPPPVGALEGLTFHSDPPSANNVFARSLPDLETPAPFVQTTESRAQHGLDEIHSEPLAEISGPHFTPFEDAAEFAFDDPSLAAPPRRVIDLGAPRPEPLDVPEASHAAESRPEMPGYLPRATADGAPRTASPEIDPGEALAGFDGRAIPAAPDTIPSPPPAGMPRTIEEPAGLEAHDPRAQPGAHNEEELAGLGAAIGAALDAVLETRPSRNRGAPSIPNAAAFAEDPSARMTEPAITPAPLIDLPPEVAHQPAPELAPIDDEAGLQALAEQVKDAAAEPDAENAPAPIEPAPARHAAPSHASPDAASSDAASPDFAGFHNPNVELRPALRARLTAWALDGALVAFISLLFVALAALQLGGRKLAPLGAQSWESWLDGLLFAHRLPILWALLVAAIAVGYSWLFTALGGRTPGLRAAGLRLEHEDGSPLDPIQALQRSTLALASALPALFGFILALVDPRGQTLHDKLSHSRLVVSGAVRRGSP